MKTQIFTRYFNIKSVFILLLLASFSQVTSCFHTSDDAVANAIFLSYALNAPTFLAVKDGDGEWVVVTVSTSGNTITITDPDGRYIVAALGNYRGQKRGYYIESSIGDAKNHSFGFDDTSATTDYTINGEADNFNFGSFYVGTKYRSFQNQTNLLSQSYPLVGMDSFQANFTQDADEPSSGDTLLTLNNSGDHIKFGMRDYTDSSTLSYTAVPADAGTQFDVDHSLVEGSANYSGLSFKFSGDNLKALLNENEGIGSSVHRFEKFSAPVGKTFAISASWAIGGSPFTTDLKYTQYYNDPPATVTVSEVPASAPNVTVGSDNNYTIRLDYSSMYLGGITGLTNQVRGAKVIESGTTVTEWHIKQTMSRYQTGAQTIGFDTALTNLANFPSGMEPTPAGLNRVSFYETNRTVQEELNFQYSGHAASEADDGMIRLRLNLNF